MGSLLAAWETLKLWQIIVLVVVLTGAAGGTYGGYTQVDGSSKADLGEDQQLIPVRFGDLVNQVSTSGNLIFPNRETLTFDSQGTVIEVLVEEGEQVVKGQVVAKLDRTTVASLNQAVAQARVDLQNVQDALAEIRNPPLLDLAQAQERIADAEFQLREATDALADAREPYATQVIKAQEEVVADARLALQDSKEALAALLPDQALELAQARQDKADAGLTLEQAQEALDGFVPDYLQELAQALQDKADDEVALRQAQETLDNFVPDYLQELAQAVQDRANAELALADAEETLAAFAPAFAQDLAQIRQSVADAEAAVDTAEEALAATAPDYTLELARVRQEQADAEDALKAAQNALDNYENTNSKTPTFRQDKVDAEALLAQALEELTQLLLAKETGSTGLDGHIQQSQRVVEIRQRNLQEAQDNVTDVERLEAAVELAQANLDQTKDDAIELETGPDLLPRQKLEAAVELAQANLEEARADLAALSEGSGSLQRQQLQATVELAQVNLDEAEGDVTDQEAGPDPLERQRLEAAVELAQANLDQAESNVAEQEAGPDPLKRQALEAAVELAGANLQKTEDLLTNLGTGPDPLEVSLEEVKVALARATLAQAEEDLAEMIAGADPMEVSLRERQVALAGATMAQAEEDLSALLAADSLDMVLAEARVTSAQLDLDNALELLEKAVLRAPMNGFVSVVDVEAGDEVAPNARIVEIVDPTVVEVDGIVDEIDVLLIREGARAAVTMDSLPGQTLEGTISTIAPAAQNQQGVVTYPIRIRVGVPIGVQLREGLSATAEIILQEETNVLLVPQQAIRGSFDEPVIRVMTNEGIQERRVVLGNSDAFWTAVREGLAEGDQVVMEVTQTTSDPFAAFRQLRGGFGGGDRTKPKIR